MILTTTMTQSHTPIPAPSGKYTGIPDYIRHAINALGGQQKSLAEALGLTPSRVSDWARGMGVPGVEMAVKLALLTGDDPVDVLTMAGHQEFANDLSLVWKRSGAAPGAATLARVKAKSEIAEIVEMLNIVMDGME